MGLEHHFSAVLQLPGIECSHRTSSLRERVIGFADVEAVEEIEHVEAQLKPVLLCKNNPSGKAKIDGRKIARPVHVSA